ncbi:MAG: helix-turn-helix transcriptional regulator [Gammaproteobacteria bacterium]|nr:helix-turn-helix transcriptional regulator [Gammaproteobacteria bacterium]
MDLYSLSDTRLEQELGHRLKALRLRKNITQSTLAQATGLSLNAIKALESGRSKLSTLVAVLRELRALEQLDNFIPQVSISPLQLAKAQGRARQRASGEHSKEKSPGSRLEW